MPQWFIAPLKGPATSRRVRDSSTTSSSSTGTCRSSTSATSCLTIRDVMSKVTLAISVVGGLVLFSGGLILIGAVAMTKFQRVYEAAVFKTLGASTGAIARMLLFEYGVLGALAGAVGLARCGGLTWGVSRFALDIPWRVFAGEHLAGVGLTALLVAASASFRASTSCETSPSDPPGRVNRGSDAALRSACSTDDSDSPLTGVPEPKARSRGAWSDSMPPGARRHERRRLDPLVYLFAALFVARYAFLR